MNVAELRQLIREELESTPIEPGYYWIRFGAEVTIGHRNDDTWFIIGDEYNIPDEQVQVIKRIPDLQGKQSIDVERHLSAASDHINRIA